MLKRDITYEDFDGDTVTETLYFNITKTELIELEVSYGDGLENAIRAIIKAQDNQALLAEFKKIITMSYGVKSEDGKRFIKSPKILDDFLSSAAWDALFMELATDEGKMSEFILGIIPKDLSKLVGQSMDPDKPTGPPQISSVPTPPTPPTPPI